MDPIQNQNFINAILNSPDGEIKTASDATGVTIRNRLREEGLVRRMFTVVPITHSELSDSLHDLPVKIDEKEPESPAAMSITLDGTSNSVFFSAPKFESTFYDITTREFVKNIDSLATYKQDLKRTITNQALLSINDQEDSNFLADVDSICGTINSVNSYSGLVHHTAVTGVMGRNVLVDIKGILEKISLPNGCILMNRITGNSLLKEGYDTVGGEFSQDMYMRGDKALEERNILGLKCVFTLKRDLVPDGVVYIFAPQEYLGKFYELHKPQMYVKREKKTLRFSAMETIAMTIANINAVHKVTLIDPS